MPQLIAQAAVSALVAVGVGLLQKALSPKSKGKKTPDAAPSPTEILTAAADPGGACIGIFGHRRVGGRTIISAKSGTATYIVIAIANSPVSGINAVYLNNRIVSRDGSGNVLDAPWASGAQYSINIKLYDGTQTVADAALDAAFPGWTADHVGYKTAYAIIKIDPSINTAVFNPVYQSGVPDFTFDVTGFKCYDPRNGAHNIADPTTWTYSGNAAIINANYLIHELGAALPTSRVDWSSVTAAANSCDEAVPLKNGGTEPRYSCSVVWTTDERHEAVLERIGEAHAGGAFFVGTKYKVRSGVFGTPLTPVITPDTYAEEGLSFAETPPLSEIANGVRGTFLNPLKNYESDDFPSYQDAAALSEDQGLPYWLDLNLSCVTSHTQAQRLARIAYHKARFGFDASAALQFTHFEFCSDDLVQITDDLAGFSAKTFRVTSDRLDENYVYTLGLEFEAASFYAWTAGTDEQDLVASDPLLGEQGTLQPPGGVLIDATPGATCAAAIMLTPSPTAGADQILVNLVGTSSSNGATLPNAAGSSAADPHGAVGLLPADSLTTCTVRAKNSVTGELSAIVSVISGTRTYAQVNDLLEAASTQYALSPPKAPLVTSVATGTAQLRVATVPGSKAQQVELWENTVNNSGTATLVGTATNSNATFVRTGSPGQVKFYWARTKNATDGKFSGFSNPTLVVF